MTPQIEHVSDTALLVAACRAMETDRPDGLVRDPFAARLAGERGMALGRNITRSEWMIYGIALRTCFIDELLLRAIGQGALDTVLNLGAGLDTRPWRLDLPSRLRWIEVDFPAMLEYKAGVLAGAEPKCRLEHASADINTVAERVRILELASATSNGLLMITEGLLMYLPAETIQALAAETMANPVFRSWLFDVTSLDLMRLAHGSAIASIESVRAESHLDCHETLRVVEESGWKVADRRSMLTDGSKIGQDRVIALVQAMAERGETAPAAPPADDVSGVWLFEAGYKRGSAE